MAIAFSLLILVGCGDQGPPDPATSERLIVEAVLDHQRFLAAPDPDAACDGLTEEAQKEIVELKAGAPRSSGDPPEDCADALGREATSDLLREVLLNSEVHAVRIDGDRATATAQTSLPDGRRPDPVEIQLRWTDGRWLLD